MVLGQQVFSIFFNFFQFFFGGAIVELEVVGFFCALSRIIWGEVVYYGCYLVIGCGR
jgi:hypothetical protein